MNKGLKDIDDAISSLKNLKAKYVVLQETVLGSSDNIQKIEKCNRMGNLYSNIQRYADYNINNSRWFTKHKGLESIAKAAKDHANELRQGNVIIHEANADKLEINKKIKNAVTNFMFGIGLSNGYSTWSYKTNRSRTATEKTHTAGWWSDIERVIITNDRFDFEEKAYDTFIKKVDTWLSDKQKGAELEQRNKDKELLKQKEVTEAITYLTNAGLSAPTDYTIETAVDIYKDLTMGAQDYVNKHGWDIVCGDDGRFEEVGTEITGEWRWGVEKDSKIKDSRDGKSYIMSYRTSSGDGGSFDDCNFDVPITEIK